MYTPLTPAQRELIEADLEYEERLSRYAREQADEERADGSDADSIDRVANQHASHANRIRRFLGRHPGATKGQHRLP